MHGQMQGIAESLAPLVSRMLEMHSKAVIVSLLC